MRPIKRCYYMYLININFTPLSDKRLLSDCAIIFSLETIVYLLLKCLNLYLITFCSEELFDKARVDSKVFFAVYFDALSKGEFY